MNYGQSGRVLWQCFQNVQIRRQGKNFIEVELNFQETGKEDNLRLLLSAKDFTIMGAVLERPRANREIIRPLSLIFLHGHSVYLKEARNLKKAILDWGETRLVSSHLCEPGQPGSSEPGPAAPPLPEREHFANLFLELITNVLQAELFLLPERGYASLQEYDRYFSGVYADSCILYSKLAGRVPEYSYTQGQERSDFLFSRNRGIFVFEQKGGEEKKEKTYLIHGHLSDSFHEMAITLKVLNSPDSPYFLAEAKGNFLRIPNLVCSGALPKLQELEGMHLIPENKKKIISRLTGPEGCSHLSDLVIEAGRALQGMEKSGINKQ